MLENPPVTSLSNNLHETTFDIIFLTIPMIKPLTLMITLSSKLTLLKEIIKRIPMYWMLIPLVMKCITSMNKKISFHLLCFGSHQEGGTPLFK